VALVAVLSFGVLPGLETSANAVKTNAAKFFITPVPAGAGLYADYGIGAFDTDNNETLTQVTFEFPAECDVSGAKPVGAGDSVSVSGQQVTVIFGTPKGPKESFTVNVADIRNPTTPGVYSLNPTATFQRSDGTTVSHSMKKTTFTILDSPYLVLTIDSGPLPEVDFGSIQPGSTPAPQTVRVLVDSSLPTR
jgi:hypothetical protein